MAFPGTLNISYYKGDTYEFNVYPKNSAGDAFDMTDYTVNFIISNARGSAGTTRIKAYSLISALEPNVIRCAIRPEDGAQLTAGTQYVYDIEIKNDDVALLYPKVYTVLTGNLTVTEQITTEADEAL